MDIARVRRLLLDPRSEWTAIAREPANTPALFRDHVAVLAAIPPVCGFIGSIVVGAAIVPAFLFAVISYVLTFPGLYLLAVVIESLATPFGARKNFASAMKLAVYFPTAYWLAGVFFLVPVLSVLVLAGLYSLYLLWAGLPVLMGVAQEKLIAYAASVALGTIIIAAIISAIAARIAGIPMWV